MIYLLFTWGAESFGSVGCYTKINLFGTFLKIGTTLAVPTT